MMADETVEGRLARVETKTDRLLKDVAEHRAETRTEFKELRGIVEANESAMRNDLHKEIKDSENNLLQEIKASENSLRQEINASENSLRIQMTRNTEAVFEIRSYVKVLLAFVLPMARGLRLSGEGHLRRLSIPGPARQVASSRPFRRRRSTQP